MENQTATEKQVKAINFQVNNYVDFGNKVARKFYELVKPESLTKQNASIVIAALKSATSDKTVALLQRNDIHDIVNKEAADFARFAIQNLRNFDSMQKLIEAYEADAETDAYDKDTVLAKINRIAQTVRENYADAIAQEGNNARPATLGDVMDALRAADDGAVLELEQYRLRKYPESAPQTVYDAHIYHGEAILAEFTQGWYTIQLKSDNGEYWHIEPTVTPDDPLQPGATEDLMMVMFPDAQVAGPFDSEQAATDSLPEYESYEQNR